MIDRNKIVTTAREGLDSARQIALAAKADPTKYLQAKIEAWNAKYLGTFRLLSDEFRAEALTTLPSVTFDWPEFGPYDLQGESTGESKDSDAVLNNLEWADRVFAEKNLIAFMDEWDKAVARKEVSRILYLYSDGPRRWVLALQTLYNTMLMKMDQGERPKPQPGPDEEIIHTPFADSIVKKDSRTIGSLTVNEFRALMAQILGK